MFNRGWRVTNQNIYIRINVDVFRIVICFEDIKICLMLRILAIRIAIGFIGLLKCTFFFLSNKNFEIELMLQFTEIKSFNNERVGIRIKKKSE